MCSAVPALMSRSTLPGTLAAGGERRRDPRAHPQVALPARTAGRLLLSTPLLLLLHGGGFGWRKCSSSRLPTLCLFPPPQHSIGRPPLV